MGVRAELRSDVQGESALARACLTDLFHTTIFNTFSWQSQVDLYLWEQLLNKHDDIKTIIELGTYYGGMSCFLLLQATNRGMDFWTFDRIRYKLRTNPVAALVGLEEHCINEDVDGGKAPKLRALLKQNRPIMLFMDNGNKKKEFALYVPALQSGDYVSVHDWGPEVWAEHIKPFQHLLEPIFLKRCEELDSYTRFWRLK